MLSPVKRANALAGRRRFLNAGYGLEPEDPYADYGYDAYENDAEPGDADGYDFDVEYDDDFDDAYLKILMRI